MQKFHEELLKTELTFLAQENCNMKMNRNWQNRSQYIVIALLLYTSGNCNKSKPDTGQVKWTFATTAKVQQLFCSQILNFKRQNVHNI